MTCRLLVGDVREKIKLIPDGDVDFLCCSPPFLALRKYGDDHAEMGSEGTPADYLDALLDLTLEFRRVLAPHGSIAIELGDTYSGSGGGGGDYLPGGLREGQPGFTGSAAQARDVEAQRAANAAHWRAKNQRSGGAGGDYGDDGLRAGQPKSRQGTPRWDRQSGVRTTTSDPVSYPARAPMGWPLAKSLALIPQLYPASLAYGHNLLNPAHTFTPWRVRNIITWCRPNPPVGALGDKVRPATSHITVACPSARRWFDLDAVRLPYKEPDRIGTALGHTKTPAGNVQQSGRGGGPEVKSDWINTPGRIIEDRGGAPPLDWWDDALDLNDPTDHMTIVMPTQPYPGAHYATWPAKLAQRLIDMMCPPKVCVTCGKPSERIVEYGGGNMERDDLKAERGWNQRNPRTNPKDRVTSATTLGWSDCGHDNWRPGHVLDPFAGSGTTLAVAMGMGRDVTGIELYPANADLIRDRVGMFLEEPV